MRRHSRAGGNPDLRLSEIFNDCRSVGFAHEYGLQKYQLRQVSIYSRGQSPRYGNRLQTPVSRLKNNPHLPASCTVIPAQAGIQAFGFQKYSMITVAWALPTNMVCRNISCGGSLYILAGKATAAACRPRKSSEKTGSTSLPASPSFPRRRESRPLIFRKIQRLP